MAGIWRKQLAAGCAVLASVFTAYTAWGTLNDALDVPHDGSWTLCLYVCGSNLESRQGWATKTLMELEDTPVPSNVTVVVQAGGAQKWRNEDVKQNGQRFLVEAGGLLDVGVADEGSMGEAGMLADFLTFCQKEYPAEHTAVVLWDHGGGPLRGVCFDEKASFDALTLDELGEALEEGVAFRGGQPYDIVGFDACLMGSLETAMTLSGNADWMIASEDLEAGAGWDYEAAIEAMGIDGADARQVGTAICDGYLAKSAESGRDSAVTLALLDLSNLADVTQAMENVFSSLQEKVSTDIGILRRFAFGAHTAEAFGGSSENEGRSNLVDLKGMADGCAEAYGKDSVPWDDISDAIDKMAVYRVSGRAAEGASGISIWYPITLEDSGLDEYVEMSPLKRYASVLEDLFAMDIDEVLFQDAGSVDEEGAFHITIDPASYESFFDLYVVNRRVDGGYEDNNVDRVDDWEALHFYWQPQYAVEVVLDGMPLDARVISYTDDYIVFSSPVLVNGEKSFLRFSWVTDEENPEGGYYEFLGVWNGVDHVSGHAGRFLENLEPGDEIEALSLDEDSIRGSIMVKGDVHINDIPMEAGEYECWFTVLDLFGRKYSSDVCCYTVDETGEVTAGMRE